MRDEIVLITRIRTLNKGNQALSVAWLAMLERAFPDARVRVLERRPRHLLQYTLRQFAGTPRPFAAFDALANRLARLAPVPGFVGPATAPAKILLDETISPPVRFASLRQRLNLRGKAAAVGLYREAYRLRLSACQRARLVVVNPAGEFFPREPSAAFYHLLDAHVAQKLGCPTAIVNHTMDITDPTLRKLIPEIYRTLSLVGFRDEKSVGAFREMGGDPANVVVTPDLALTIEPSAKPVPRKGTIAVAINVPEAAANHYLDQWKSVIAALREQQFEIEMVSNELPLDLPFYEELKRQFGDLRFAGANLDHDRYCELLGSYDLVISSRMHTGILAMIAGTPVVPVEGSSFKITGLFQELGFTTPVIRPSDPTWVSQVVEQAARARDHRDALAVEVATRIAAVRERITSLLVPRLRAVVEPKPKVRIA